TSPLASRPFTVPTRSHLPIRTLFFFLMRRPPPRSTLFPYTTLFRSRRRGGAAGAAARAGGLGRPPPHRGAVSLEGGRPRPPARRSEEHTSELQSLTNIVCRLLLGKKKKKTLRELIVKRHGRQR